MSKFQITIHVEDVTPAFKDDDSIYDEKDTYVLGYSPSKLENSITFIIGICIYVSGFNVRCSIVRQY